MKRFQFTLSKVAAYRQQEKKLKEIELASKQRQLAEAISQQETEQTRLKHLLDWDIESKSDNPVLLLAHRARIESQRARVRSASDAVAEFQKEWAEASEASRKANTAFEVLEQLREEQHSEHQKENMKSELIEQSDIYLRQWALKQDK